MLIKIFVCNRRTDKKYKNKKLEWDYIIDRNRNPARTSETVEEYSKLPKAKRGELKDIGGLVGGWLKERCSKAQSAMLKVRKIAPPRVPHQKTWKSGNGR